MKETDYYPDIRSRERVKNLGEVHTPRSTINSMLDFSNNQTDLSHPNCRVLEPTCGHGPFLEAILEKKISSIPMSERIGDDFFYKSLICLTNIYGVDIDDLNVKEARKRQLSAFCRYCDIEPHHPAAKTAQVMIKTIILKGDFLEPKFNITEWKPVKTGCFERTEYDSVFVFSDFREFTSPLKEYSPLHWKLIGQETNFSK